MKQIKTTRKPARWTAWASRFGSRFHRHADAFAMALLLHVRCSRTSVMVEERWLRPILDLRPHLHWSITESAFSCVDQVFARQFNFMVHARQIVERSSAPQAILARTAVSPGSTIEGTHPLTWRVDHLRREFATLLERQFVERRDFSSTSSTERLVHRLNRIEQRTVIERSMTLRHELVGVARSIGEPMSPANVQMLESRKPARPPAQPQTLIPDFNVDQLADQVIQKIDRRVIARRERMGRT